MTVDYKTLKRKMLEYKIRQIIDTILPAIFLFFTSIWLIQSVVAMIFAGTWNTAVFLFPVGIGMSASSCFNVMAVYIVSYSFYRTFFLGHDRVVRALLFTIFGAMFSGAIWSFCNFYVNHTGEFLLPIVSTAVIGFFIVIINKRQKVLDLNWKRIVPVFLFYAFTLYLFVSSGFFQQWGLYEQGLAQNPTGWQWLLETTTVLWMWLAIELR